MLFSDVWIYPGTFSATLRALVNATPSLLVLRLNLYYRFIVAAEFCYFESLSMVFCPAASVVFF